MRQVCASQLKSEHLASEAGGTGLSNEFLGYRRRPCFKETESQVKMKNLFCEVSSVMWIPIFSFRSIVSRGTHVEGEVLVGDFEILFHS